MPKYRLSKVAGRNNWHIVWSDKGKTKRASTGTENRAEAQAFLEAFLSEQAGYRKLALMTTGGIIEAYIKEREPVVMGPKTLWARYKAIGNHIRELPPSAITRNVCREHVAKRQRRGLSNSTIRDELALIRTAFNYAEKEGWLDKAPYIELPQPSPPRDRWLTKQEARKLLKSTKSFHLKLFIRIGLFTAARSGAILDLEWDRVDLERRRIDFKVPGRPTTKKGRAVVPINTELLGYLEKAKERATTDHVIEYGGRSCESIKRAFRRTARSAGFTDVTPHTLRHTAATWMAQAGVSMWQIAGMLGHRDSRTTERVYAKHSPEFLAEAANAVSLKVKRRLRKKELPVSVRCESVKTIHTP